METIKLLLAFGAAASLVSAPAFAHEGHPHHKAKMTKTHHSSATPKKGESSMSNMSAADMKKMDMKTK